MQPVAILSIQRYPDRYEFVLRVPTQNVAGEHLYAPVAVSGTTLLTSALHTRLGTAIEAAADTLRTQFSHAGEQHGSGQATPDHALAVLGGLVYGLLLPPQVQAALHALPALLPLLIETNDVELPWELMHDGSHYCALQRSLSRQILSATVAQVNPAAIKAGRSFLFISNPTGDLPQTEIETERLIELFDTAPERIDAQFLGGVQATRLAVLQALGSGHYDAIHYSGHARRDALLLADGELTAVEIQRALRGQPFVFLNACSSAPVTMASSAESSEGDLPYAGRSVGDLATAFVLGGAVGLVGTRWPIFDASSREFAELFYTLALDGVAVGEALRQTRDHAYAEQPGDPLWASYTLYGDPTMRIAAVARRAMRTVTVLCARVSGLAELYAACDLEMAADAENELLDICAQVARRYGGRLRPATSDWLTVEYGVVEANENDAERSVRTALELCSTWHSTGHQSNDQNRPQTTLHIGISTGQVLSRHARTEQGMDSQTSSNVELRATELARGADAGHLLVDENTRRLTQSVFLFTALAGTSATPPAVYRVEGERVASLSYTPLIGRTGEVGQLLGWWREALGGQGRLVGMVGAAGVGKSRLVQAFTAELADTELDRIGARCQSYDSNISHALVGQIVRGLARMELTDAEDEQRQKLAMLVTNVASATDNQSEEALALLGETVGLAFPSPSLAALEPELRQKKLTSLVRALVQAQTARTPTLLVLEDLQWADEVSLAILDQIAATIGRMRLLLLAVYRPEWSHDWTKWSHYRQLAVDELDAKGQHRLMAELLHVETVASDITAPILAWTGGNPFFIREAVSFLVDGGNLVRMGGTWGLNTDLDTAPLPDTIEHLLQARIDRLAAPSREVLGRAAVIGQEFEVPVLAQVQDELARQKLDRNLGELTDHQMVMELGGWWPDITYAFRHGLIHRAAYTGLLEQFRRTVHRVVARILRQLYGDGANRVERIAQHYDLSDDRLNAILYSLEAARRATAAWANNTALGWYDRALAKLETFDTLPSTESERQQGGTAAQLLRWQVEATEGKGDTLSTVGRHSEALLAYARAYDLLSASQQGTPQHLAQLARQVARQHGWIGQMEQALTWMENGRGLIGGGESHADKEALALIDIHTASLFYQQGQYAAAIASARRGLSLVNGIGAPGVKGEGYLLLGSALDAHGEAAAALDAYQRSVELWTAQQNRYQIARTENNIATICFHLGDWPRARELYGGVLPFFRDEMEDQNRSAVTLTNLGLLEYNLGDYGRADACHCEALGFAETSEIPWLEALIRVNRAWVYVANGKGALAQAEARQAIALEVEAGIAQSQPEALRVLAHVAADQGHLSEALTHAEQALTLALAHGDRLEEANALREQGRVRRLAGDFAAAEADLTQSLAVLEELENPFEAARTRRQLAWLYQAQDAGEQTLEQLLNALRVFVELGASGEIASLLADERARLRLALPATEVEPRCRHIMAGVGWQALSDRDDENAGTLHLRFTHAENGITLQLNAEIGFTVVVIDAGL